MIPGHIISKAQMHLQPGQLVHMLPRREIWCPGFHIEVTSQRQHRLLVQVMQCK